MAAPSAASEPRLAGLQQFFDSYAWRVVLAAGAVVWLLWLSFAAISAGQLSASPIRRLVAAAAYVAGSVICHQRPERSFFLWGAQFPVCARCTGLYVGAAAAALVGTWPPLARRGDRPLLVLLIAAAPAVASLAFEWI